VREDAGVAVGRDAGVVVEACDDRQAHRCHFSLGWYDYGDFLVGRWALGLVGITAMAASSPDRYR